MNQQLTYKPFGSQAVLIEWEQSISPKILKDIQQFQQCIESELSDFVLECIPAYASLTVLYRDINFKDLIGELKACYQNKENKAYTLKNNTWQLPVCYDHSLGFDLLNYAASINLTPKEVIDLHTLVIYTIYFLGFLPGFIYLGNLDERLHLPRKAVPLLKVPEGAVGIGGKQTGIYPQVSPGGWHIIGNCPVEMFNVENNPPSPFKAGDQIQFIPISLKDYQSKSFRLTSTNLC